GSAGVLQRKRVCSEIVEWLEPGLEIGTDRIIALHVNAADPAGTVIQVVVNRKLVVIRGLDELRFRGVRVWRPEERSSLHLAKLLLHVLARTVQALRLTRPQCNADRPARLESRGEKDAGRFHRNRRTGSVVGRTACGMPRIQVGPYHH